MKIGEDFDRMVGMGDIKRQYTEQMATAAIDMERKKHGLPVPDRTMHMVFTGPPGTGKTTTAKKMAEAYHALGLIDRPHVEEADRGSLVAGVMGQTPIKTQEKFDKAKGGVLFIDEAYNLKQDDRDMYGDEAMTTLMRLAEENRNNTAVIMAGYKPEMQQMMARNPGMKSRFPTEVKFRSYTPKEKAVIGEQMLGDLQMKMNPSAKKAFTTAVPKLAQEGQPDGNARDVRNFVDKVIVAQSVRLAKSPKALTPKDLTTITAADISRASKDIASTRPTVTVGPKEDVVPERPARPRRVA